MSIGFAIVGLLLVALIILGWKVRRSGRATTNELTGIEASSAAENATPHAARGRETTLHGSISRPAQDSETADGMVAETHDEPVTVLETYNSTDLLVAKSLLDSANIPYYAKGESEQDALGGRLWSGGNLGVGPLALQVPPEFVASAKALLEAQPDVLDSGEPPPESAKR